MAHINHIFKFLKDYYELSNPVVTDIIKQPWSMKLSNLPQIKEIWSVYHTQELGETILKVIKPVLKPCPNPEENLLKWLNGNWRKVSVDAVTYKEEIVTKIPMKTYVCRNCNWIYDPRIGDLERGIAQGTDFYRIFDKWDCPQCGKNKESFYIKEEVVYLHKERFLDDPKRLNLFEVWIIKRNNWRNIEFPKEQGLNLYNILFKLYSDIKKESETFELVVGDGQLYWQSESKMINHPVIFQKVVLEFISQEPSFIIKYEEEKTDLYTSMLRVIPTLNQTMLSEIIQDIENNSYRIADTINNKSLFKRLIHIVDEKGKFLENDEKDHNGPTIRVEPILFLRKRNQGFSIFLDKIIEEINEDKEIKLPGFLKRMIGNHPGGQDVIIDDVGWNQSGIDENILLTLSANNDQLKIMKYLNHYGAVLVQGPPGTGKTHTIANLIGHLLSQGSRVLVTSHTEKALTVLKEKVYQDLQSLCISLLSASSQRKEMDNALFEIASKGTSLDLGETKKKIERLELERKELVVKSKAKKQELLKIRSLEYKDLIFDNQSITPIEAAQFVNSGEGEIDYIPGKTTDDQIGLPLSLEELRELYYTNNLITIVEEELLSKELPDLKSLWIPADFIVKTEKYVELSQELFGWEPNKLVLQSELNEDWLREIQKMAMDIFESLKEMKEYQLAIIEKVIKDQLYHELWQSFFEDFNDLLINYEEYRKICYENDYVVSELLLTEENLNILDEIILSGKEYPISFLVNIFKPQWKKLYNEITNNNRRIEKRKDFENLKVIFSYELQQNKLLHKFNKLLAEVTENGFMTKINFEEKVQQYRKKIAISLNWYKENWEKLTGVLKENSLNSLKFDEISVIDLEKPIETLKNLLENIFIPDISNRYKLELLKNLNKEMLDYVSYLNNYKACGESLEELFIAIKEKNYEQYQKSYNILEDIMAKSNIYNKRTQLLIRLQEIAPTWATAIKKRDGIHGSSLLPENIQLAWKWRQLSNQINRIDSYDPNQIQKELRKINEALMDNAQRLANEKAWYHNIKNKTSEQTQAIEGWRQTIRQIGKGTGKNAPILQQKARDLMPLCQTAIPVWIMSLNRVAENFDPQKNKFDVVIIDEASQADILGLAAIYLGKKVIVVGDDQQVSPESVGIKNEEIQALIAQYLDGIPNKHLFNEKTSVYDLAKMSGFKPLMLREHFRCLPEIIEFSNRLSYNGKIKPLRDTSGVGIKPSVISIRVANASRWEKVNKLEAEYIAALVCACAEDEAYRGKTIGVISLLGNEQALEIDKLLQTNLEPKEYEERRIQCGKASQFQGDERDVIFLSMVAGPNEKGGPLRLLSEDGNNDLTRKRYNVAASRAKDQMWVVYSLNPEIDLKPDDIRLRLIKHAMNPQLMKNEEKVKKTESEFEKEVMKRLLNQGYQVIPQWEVGAYRIDMVVEDGERRLALECDGEKWHTQDELPNDLKRQAILERLGWKFIRIRGSAFYRNPEKTMQWVFEELVSYGIKPNFNLTETAANTDDDCTNEIIERIKRRTEKIIREWRGEPDLKDGMVETKNNLQRQEEITYDIKILDNIKNNKKIDEKDIPRKMVFKAIAIDEIHDPNDNQEKVVKKELQKPLFDFRKK